MLIINGNLHTMAGCVYENGYIVLENGKIQQIGPKEETPDSYAGEIMDAAGSTILPGLVDAHTHMGLFEDSLGFEGEDGNEDTDPTTPQMRVIDAINPMERSFAEAVDAGVTTVVVSPGSTNPAGGQIAAIKTYGRRIDDMVIRQPLAMKFALGENPKYVYHEKGQTPTTRMATAAILRELLKKAREYAQNLEHSVEEEDFDEPEYDAKLEALLPLLRKEIPAHFHAHRADDIFTAIRIAKEFDLDYVILHGTEGHLVADILAEEGTKLIIGPSMTDRSKPELTNLDTRAAAILYQAGVPFSICTDHPETPEKYLMDCAGLAVRNGLVEEAALEAITIRSAEIAGIADRVGSLEVGKDGDLVCYTGNPLDYRTRVQAVIIEGKIVRGELKPCGKSM